MAKFLRIALWNANGIIKHKEELQVFLQNQLIDIMLISETHLTEKSYLKIPGYKLYHTIYPDNTAHAGPAILIKSTINHHQLHKYEKDYLHATSIRVKTLPYEITVSAIHCPPRHHVKEEDFMDFFQTLDPKFIVGGDFNSKHTLWGSRPPEAEN
jgi:exonuclease III